jgi:hypothetical protein
MVEDVFTVLKGDAGIALSVSQNLQDKSTSDSMMK